MTEAWEGTAAGDETLVLGRSHAGAAQMRKRQANAYTEEQLERFIDALAATCNVSLAARRAGMKSTGAIYRRRERDPDFAAAWDEALAIAYDRLELAMLERATRGVRKTVFHAGRKIATITEYGDAIALKLLGMHREHVREIRLRQGARDPDAAFEEIMRKLAEIRVRMRADETAAGKGGDDGGD